MTDIEAVVGSAVRDHQGRTGRIGKVSLPWVTLHWEDEVNGVTTQTCLRSAPEVSDDFEILTTDGWTPLGWLIGVTRSKVGSRDPESSSTTTVNESLARARDAMNLLEGGAERPRVSAHKQRHSPFKKHDLIGAGAYVARKRSKHTPSWICNKDPAALGLDPEFGGGAKAYQQHCVKRMPDGTYKPMTLYRGKTGERRAYMAAYNPLYRDCVRAAQKAGKPPSGKPDCGPAYAKSQGGNPGDGAGGSGSARPEREREQPETRRREREREEPTPPPVPGRDFPRGLEGSEAVKREFARLSASWANGPRGPRTKGIQKDFARTAADNFEEWAYDPTSKDARKYAKGLSAVDMIDLRDAVRLAYDLPNPGTQQDDQQWQDVSKESKPKPLKGLTEDEHKSTFVGALNRVRVRGPWVSRSGKERAVAGLFGRVLHDRELAELSGQAGTASKDDVKAGRHTRNDVDIEFSESGERIDMSVSGGGVVDMHRTISPNPDNSGKLRIYNSYFRASKDGVSGAGPAMLAAELRAIESAGLSDRITSIDVSAAQGSVTATGVRESGAFAGGYVWGRVGYQTDLKRLLRYGYPQKWADLQQKFGDIETLHELMQAPGGAAWWRDNAVSFVGNFSTQSDATSRKILFGYLREKVAQRRGAAGSGGRVSEQADRTYRLLDDLRDLVSPVNEGSLKDKFAQLNAKKAEVWLMTPADDKIFDKVWANARRWKPDAAGKSPRKVRRPRRRTGR